MPHQEHKHLDQLDASLQQLSDKSRDFIICGDFNCSDVDWETGTVPPGASERPVQEKLVELSLKHHLSQIHELPTRQGSHLDLVFATNPSLTKASVNIPGLSDHDAIITD